MSDSTIKDLWYTHMTFLNKQEIIERLKSLPDGLPVVIERDSDVLRSTGIRKIEVVKATRVQSGNIYLEYCDYGEPNQEDVIWIS